jgi:hypothetical protein
MLIMTQLVKNFQHFVVMFTWVLIQRVGVTVTLLLIILSRVRGSVTNNNGFGIGLLDLLTPSCTISFNANQL